MEHLTRRDVDDLRPVVSERETEETLEDVGQLLVLVRVQRYDAALLEIDVGEHQPFGGDEAALQVRLEPLLRQVLPAVKGCAGTGHDCSSRLLNGAEIVA